MACEFYQIDFLKDPDVCRLEYEVAKNFRSQERVRRGLHAKVGGLNKICAELTERLDILERNICKNYKE